MRGRARLAVALLGCSILLGRGQSAGAEETKRICPICASASSETASYSAKAGTTLVRGSANTLLGWTELIRQPVEETKAGGNVLVGIGKGVGQGVMRTVEGIGELLTFWTPKVHDHYVHFAKDCPVCMGTAQAAPPQ